MFRACRDRVARSAQSQNTTNCAVPPRGISRLPVFAFTLRGLKDVPMRPIHFPIRAAVIAVVLVLLVGFSSPSSAAHARKKQGKRRATRPAATAVAQPAPSPAASDVEAAMAQQLLERVNAERATRGIAPLRWDPGLASMARNWSETMASTGNFTHRPKGSESTFAVPAVCCWENIYSVGGSMGSAQLHDGWMRSTGHRNNMLSAEVTVMGAGVVCGAGGNSYATQNFATDAWKGVGTPATAPEPRAAQTGADISCPQ
jgi:uncharacterized protein YkwD